MNKTIKLILLIAGTGLLGYGIYLLVMPETSLDLGIVDIETQDNKNAYITIGLGITSTSDRLFAGKNLKTNIQFD